MNALIDLNKCREYMSITIGGKEHQIKLSGTIDDPYFCGKDICVVLGYKNSKNALHRYVDVEEKKTFKELGFSLSENPNSLGKINHNITHNEGQIPFISESGLYNLIMHSNAPFAKDFQKLVCKTILPSIRKYGSYQVETQLSLAMEKLAIKEKSEEQLRKEQEELQAQLSIKEKLEEELKDRVIKAERKAIRVNLFMS